MSEIPKVIAEVRKTGQTNMFSQNNVADIAHSLGYKDVSNTINDMNSREYMEYLEESANY